MHNTNFDKIVPAKSFSNVELGNLAKVANPVDSDRAPGSFDLSASDALEGVFLAYRRMEDGEATTAALIQPLEDALECVPADHFARALLEAAKAANDRAMASYCHERLPEALRAVEALQELCELAEYAARNGASLSMLLKSDGCTECDGMGSLGANGDEDVPCPVCAERAAEDRAIDAYEDAMDRD